MKTSPTGNNHGRSPEHKAAFTLTELLIVVAVIALLAIVHTAARAEAKDQTKTGLCANNIRRILMAMQIYASDNRDKLPTLTGWAWDLPASVGTMLLNTGIKKGDFYCPGTSPRFTDKENWAAPGIGGTSLWNFGVTATPPGPNDFRIIGYALALSGNNVAATNQNTTILPESVSGTVVPAAQSVLVADAIISTERVLPGYLNPVNNYVSIAGGFQQNGLTYPHVSPHLKGAIPMGGNVGFKDGHVAWRNFELMVPRSTTVGRYFWW